MENAKKSSIMKSGLDTKSLFLLDDLLKLGLLHLVPRLWKCTNFKKSGKYVGKYSFAKYWFILDQIKTKEPSWTKSK